MYEGGVDPAFARIIKENMITFVTCRLIKFVAFIHNVSLGLESLVHFVVSP